MSEDHSNNVTPGISNANGNVNNHHHHDEESPLLDPGNDDSPGTTDSALGFDSEKSTTSSEEEIYGLWPATFERSISLLAGPTMNAKEVDLMTRSPRVVPPQVEQARIHLKKLNRGFLTPETMKPPKMVDSPEPMHFKKGMAKVKSLDFAQTGGNELSMKQARQIEQQRKLEEAHEYRQKVLANTIKKQQQPPPSKQPKREDDAAFHSPGYKREKTADKKKIERIQHEGATKQEKKSTFSQSLFNMANILMGVGMLGLPFVLKSAGWIGGFIVTFLFAAITWRTSVLIGRELNGDPRPGRIFCDSPFKSPLAPGSSPAARLRPPVQSFPEIARESFGNKGAVALAIVLYFELFSCLAIFLVSLGDHMHSLFPSVSVTHHMIVIAIILTLPTALLRTPTLLSYLSAVGTFATVAVVVAVFLSAILEGDVAPEIAAREHTNDDTAAFQGPYHKLWKASGLPLALGLIAYTFSGHAIVPSIYSSMERPQDFERMVDVTFLIVLSSCLVVAISGYYMFGDVVQDQVTISLASISGNAEFAMKALTWLMVLTAFSKFTLTMFPLALGMEEIIAPYVHSEKLMEMISSSIKLLLIGLALMVAIFVPSFSFLCSLVGLICTIIVSVIFPAAAHLKLFGPHLSLGEKVVDWVFIMGGAVSALVGTYATVEI